MLQTKPEGIYKIGKRYYGVRCYICDKEITREIYDYHMGVNKYFYCSMECSSKNREKELGNTNDWLKAYNTKAPKHCQVKQSIVSCLDCKESDCNYDEYNH